MQRSHPADFVTSRPFRAAHRTSRIAALTATLLLLAGFADGARAATPRVHAIVGARIVPAPGQVIPRGNIVLRDGIIVAVGANAVVPADARVWKGDSLTVYAGLIDAFVLPADGAPAPAATPVGGPGGGRPAPTTPTRGAAHELSSVTPEWRVIEHLPIGKDQVEGLRAAGFAAVQLAPRRGIVRGQSALVGLGEGPGSRNAPKPDAAQVIALQPVQREYPSSLMGAIAVVRQALLDARWYRDAWETYRKSPLGKERPAQNLAWDALEPVVAGRQPVLFVTDEMLEVLRAGAIAKEAGIAAAIVGEGDEYKRAKEIAARGFPLVVPVDFPEPPPSVTHPEDVAEVPIEELRHWDQAPGNPAALTRAGIRFALTANGLKDVKTFRAQVAKAIARGLPAERALAAVTTVPAQILGVSDRLGTLVPGRIANLTVTRGDLFAEKSKVREVWVDGNRYEVGKDETDLAGKWSIGWGGARHVLNVSAEKETTITLIVGPDTLRAYDLTLEQKRLRFMVRRGGELPEAFDLEAGNDALAGTLSVEKVGSHPVTAVRVAESDKPKDKDKDEPLPTPVVMGNSEAWRMPAPDQPAALLVRNATVWTGGPQGTLENADVLVRAGKIAAVGKNLQAPAKAVTIDGTGKHVSPGIIDCHNHWAILGNVNECTNSITAEVRIGDVINSESIDIYRELAGGVTMVHLLHGSCNSIGGQCAVIKMRWGAAPDDLLDASAPATIKFALGENPKQANFGNDRTGRYPQTRMGVEQTIRDAFTRARDYRDAWSEWRAKRRPLPPRRDLQLEALVEILEGKRMVHPHSYRQDEILMMMRVAEEFGFKVATFQHVLEGYKVADEMATHGAGGSTFSDWWGYKYEVIDAIPWNGYLMWDRGVNVSYNSDSNELARRLNTEAAKAAKYGGVPEAEALKFVTLNPAKQLKVERFVGSLEPGKDADFAIWSQSPLSTYAVCEQTWVDGRKYFDRAADLAGRAQLETEREQLVAKAKAAKKGGSSGAPQVARRWPPRYLADADMSGNSCGHEGHEEQATGLSSGMRREAER